MQARWLTLWLLAVVVFAGCDPHADLNESCGVDPETGKEHLSCRDGLRCSVDCAGCEGVCEPRGDSPLDHSCEIAAECANGALCSRTMQGKRCSAAHSFHAGEACEQTLECELGLLCGGSSFASRCVMPATAALSSDCQVNEECVPGAYCDGECRAYRQRGESCSGFSRCRPDLLCSGGGSCIAPRTLGVGAACALSLECAGKLHCHERRRGCAPAGAVARGGACSSTEDCLAGLVCAEAQCREAGVSQEGEACQGRTACAAGLDCKRIGDLKQCTSPPAERCFDELSTPLAYFEVPRASQPVWEFYRLPFPNDIRRSDRGLDLRGHLAFVYPIDSAAVVRDLERSKDGFSTNPVIHFRFSTPIRTSTLTEESLQLVDITPDSPTYKQRVDVEWRFDPTGSLYSCGNWLAVSPRPGDVLRPRTTYAALLTRQVRASNGNAVARSADFQAMLRDEAPPEVSEAHASYAPLRAFARDTETDLDQLLNATVFTTHDPERLVIGLREAVARDGVPALHDVTLCSQGTRSPCEDAGRGACSDVDPEYWEVHGRISLPVYQHGAPPYTAAADGGGLQLDTSGVPVLARRENVCFAITVPKHGGGGPLPVVLFGHGTGGSFRGVVTGGLARDLATGVVDGRPLRTASVGFDLPQHGSRRGGSMMEPEHLFFNVANPIAARGNVLQGTADFFAWLSFLTKGDTRPIADALGIQVGFDTQHIAIFTHSQGSTHASIALPYAPEVLAAVLSGNGGHLVTSLLTKTQPVDVAGLIAVGLLDPVGGIDPSNVAAIRNAGVSGGRFNPMLSLIQGYFDASDPLNFAYRLQRDPWSGAPAGHHVFMTYGLDDHFSTEPTLQAYARAAQFVHVTPALVAFGLAESAPPLRGNAVLAGVPRTLGLRQYRPDPGDDGHHVATRTVKGRADALRFLLESLAGNTPSIGTDSE